MKQDKAEKIIQKAEKRAEKAAAQVQIATQKAEKEAQRAAERMERKAARQTEKATKKAEKEARKADKAAQKAEKASQKAEEKRAKIMAAAASAALDGTGELDPDGGGPGRGKKKKLLLLLLPVLAVAVGAGVFFFLRHKGPEEVVVEPIPVPAAYAIEETQIPALPVWGEVTVYQYPVEAGTPEGEEAEAAADAFPAADYVYEGLSSPKSLAAAYTALMTAEDAGFFTVDDTFVKTDAPDFSAQTGSGTVLLARNAPVGEDGSGAKKVQTLRLSWEGQTCTVRVDLPEGRVKDPAPPPEVETGTVTQMIESLRDLPPSVLGLEGDSMDAYRIYTQDGTAKVDGNPCLRVNVYMAGGSGGNNQIVGSYFLSTDGMHVYRFDPSSSSVTELDIQDALQ